MLHFALCLGERTGNVNVKSDCNDTQSRDRVISAGKARVARYSTLQ